MIEAAIAALLLVGAVFSYRYAWWRAAVDYRHPRILMYHMVRPALPGGRFNKLRVTPAAFERQLKWLADNGWRFAFLSELDGRHRDMGKTVVLTFDDGFHDNYVAAHPLLAKYGAKATLFLVVDRGDRDWSTARKAHHDSGELRAEDKVDDAEVRAMLDSGLWELGAHTLTHALLPAIHGDEKRREIVGSKQALEAAFGKPVRAFAYPFGIYGDDDVDAVAAAGYRMAVTTEEGVSTDLAAEALRLKRVRVSGKDGRLAFALRMKTGRRGL